MERVTLKVPGRVVSAVSADVGGDGQRDVLVIWRQGAPPNSRGRVSVYRARGGRVEPKPAQVLDLPKRTVAFDVGDATGDGRADLLLLMGDGVWCLPGLEGDRLAAEPVRLVEVMTLAALPHEDRVPPMRLLVPLGPGGRPGLLIPTVPIGPMSLYLADKKGRYRLAAMLRIPFRTNLYTEAEDMRSSRDFSALFQMILPRFDVLDSNADGLPDLIFFHQDAVAVFRARKGGRFEERADLRQSFGLLTDRERVRRGTHIRGSAADFNADGRADLMFNKSSGGIADTRSQVRVYLARADGDFATGPDLTITSDGYGAFSQTVDVDGDGRDDLVRPYVEMGIMAMSRVLLTGKIPVDFHLHLTPQGRVQERSTAVLSVSFAVDFKANQDLSGLYPIFGTDFTGDGQPDVVLGLAGEGSGQNPDRIELRPGQGKGRFADAVWGISLPATQFVVPFRPTADGRPGLLVAFPTVRDREGDVWVFYNTGAWPPVR
jgi:hypothetical protein